MSSDKIEHINLYFKNDKVKEEMLKKSTPYERYIILMNQMIQDENQKLKDKNEELRTENSNLQEEVDTYDTSKRYTKGLLKNLVELEKLRGEVVKYHEQKLKDINTQQDNTFYNVQRNIIVYDIGLVLFLFLLYFFNIFNFLLRRNLLIEFMCLFFIYHLSILSYTYFIFYKKEKLTIENDTLTELQTKIKKIVDSQDFLYDYIDNL